MKRAFLLVAMYLFAGASQAHELDQAFGKEISISKSGNIVRIEYCPDNTCEAFSLASTKAEAIIKDFVFVYLFSISDYIYLENFQSDENSSQALSLIKRYQAACPNKKPREAAKCIVSLLATAYPIKANFVRYDEGTKSSTPISLAAYRRGP